MVLDFIAQTAPAPAIGSSWLPCPLHASPCMHEGLVLFVFVFYLLIFGFSISLCFGATRHSRPRLFAAPVTMSLKSSGSFYWRIVIRKQDVQAYFKDSYRFLRPGPF